MRTGTIMLQVKGAFFSPRVCVCVLIVGDITFNETEGKGSDKRGKPEVDS